MKVCCIAGCKRDHYGRGLCKKHYQQAAYHGVLDSYDRAKVRNGATLDERLRNIGWTVTDNGCWEWNGHRNHAGYGRLAVGHFRDGDPRRSVPATASRVAYMTWVGQVRDDEVVCHRCDNPPCINPDHLFIGDLATNSSDMVTKGRSARGERRTSHKLKDQQVAEIRTRYSQGGVRQRDLAEEYGVSQQLVSHLVRGTRRPLRVEAEYS